MISFAFFGVVFRYVAGIYVCVGLDLSPVFGMHFNPGISSFSFYINQTDASGVINLNLVALAFIYWINKLTRKIKAEETEEEITEVLSWVALVQQFQYR